MEINSKQLIHRSLWALGCALLISQLIILYLNESSQLLPLLRGESYGSCGGVLAWWLPSVIGRWFFYRRMRCIHTPPVTNLVTQVTISEQLLKSFYLAELLKWLFSILLLLIVLQAPVTARSLLTGFAAAILSCLIIMPRQIKEPGSSVPKSIP